MTNGRQVSRREQGEWEDQVIATTYVLLNERRSLVLPGQWYSKRHIGPTARTDTIDRRTDRDHPRTGEIAPCGRPLQRKLEQVATRARVGDAVSEVERSLVWISIV